MVILLLRVHELNLFGAFDGEVGTAVFIRFQIVSSLGSDGFTLILSAPEFVTEQFALA
jgi:hypothetical protein